MAPPLPLQVAQALRDVVTILVTGGEATRYLTVQGALWKIHIIHRSPQEAAIRIVRKEPS